MTEDELAHIFRFQLVEDDQYTPTGSVELYLYQGKTRLSHRFKDTDINLVLDAVKGYEFEGYKDRIPYFVKPDPDQG